MKVKFEDLDELKRENISLKIRLEEDEKMITDISQRAYTNEIMLKETLKMINSICQHLNIRLIEEEYLHSNPPNSSIQTRYAVEVRKKTNKSNKSNK